MLLKHIPTGDLYPPTPQLMARVGQDMEQVADDGGPIVEESPVVAAAKTEPKKAPKGKAIQIEGEE